MRTRLFPSCFSCQETLTKLSNCGWCQRWTEWTRCRSAWWDHYCASCLTPGVGPALTEFKSSISMSVGGKWSISNSSWWKSPRQSDVLGQLAKLWPHQRFRNGPYDWQGQMLSDLPGWAQEARGEVQVVLDIEALEVQAVLDIWKVRKLRKIRRGRKWSPQFFCWFPTRLWCFRLRFPQFFF